MLVTFETARLAKEKGFKDNKCKQYNRIGSHIFKSIDAVKVLSDLGFVVSAPTQSELQKWLREVHKINVESNYLPNIQKYSCLYIPMRGKALVSDAKYVSKVRHDTYEKALEEGLQEALKLIKQC